MTPPDLSHILVKDLYDFEEDKAANRLSFLAMTVMNHI